MQPKPRHLPYEVDSENDRHGFYENHWKRVALQLLLKHYPPTGQTVLDYGSGRGESILYFKQAGYDVTGTDVDEECVRLSSKYGKCSVLDVSDPVKQFGVKSFDVVTCFHVLEHVENPKKTLTDLVKIARSYVVLAVPNLRYLNWMFKRKIDLSMVNEGHLQAWDHWHFRNLAERYCGLELVEWGMDATVLPGLSTLSQKLFGNKVTIKLETTLFRQAFPFHGISVLGLFRVK